MKHLKVFSTIEEREEFKVTSEFITPCVLLVRPDIVEYHNSNLNGIRIQHIDQTLYTYQEWSSALNSGKVTNGQANGVAVGDGIHAIVVSKVQHGFHQWSNSSSLVDGIVTTTNASVAKKDFDGAGNTSKIIKQLGIDNAPAAKIVSNYVWPDGLTDGHLPAGGQVLLIVKYHMEINNALSLIGGTALANYLPTSTQVNADNFWICPWDNGDFKSQPKTSATNFRVRAVRTLL